jgi:hypothetical protein
MNVVRDTANEKRWAILLAQNSRKVFVRVRECLDQQERDTDFWLKK